MKSKDFRKHVGLYGGNSNRIHFQRNSCTFLHKTVATCQYPEFPMTGHFDTVFVISFQ